MRKPGKEFVRLKITIDLPAGIPGTHYDLRGADTKLETIMVALQGVGVTKTYYEIGVKSVNAYQHHDQPAYINEHVYHRREPPT